MIHQIGHLLTHGLHRSPEHDGTRDTGAPGNVQCHGASSHEVQPSTKRRRKGPQEGQNTASAAEGGAEDRPATSGDADGQASDQNGCRPESSEKARLLRLLHANGAGVSDPRPQCQSQAMASRDGAGISDENPGLEAIEIDSYANLGGDDATTTAEAVRLQASRSAVSDGHESQPCPGGVLLSEMGSGKSATDPNHSGANCNGEDEEVHGTIGGDNSRPGQHHQVPPLVGNRGAECHPMALADLSALRRVADATGDPGREQSVESAGSGTQTAQPQSELTGAAAESHVGEGQECWQGQSAQEMRTATSFDRKAVQYALSQLVLHNDRNHCYINAAMAETLWAFLSRSDFQPCHSGPHATLIADCILNHAGTPVTLAAQSWFQEVMQQWPQQHNQGDPVEFLSHVSGAWDSPNP